MKEIPISQVDALFADGSYPIEFLFFYEKVFDTKRLRNSLNRLSTPFFPLFGDHRGGKILFERYHEQYHFDEESKDQELDLTEFKVSSPDLITRYAQKGSQHLFFLKVIRYRNGMILIPRMDHLAGDGYSYFAFLSILAALTQPPKFPLKSPILAAIYRPRHHRTVLRKFSFSDTGREPFRPEADYTIEHIEIPCQEIRTLIRNTASREGARISSNDVLATMATKRLVELKPDSWADEIELTLPIDVRCHLKEYGRRFFGNSLMLHTLKFDKKQLVQSPPEEAAVRVRSSLPEITRQVYLKYLEKLELLISKKDWKRFRPYDPRSGCLVTNLSRLPVDRLDFGSGPPRTVIPLTVEKNSAGIMRNQDNYVLRIVR